MVKIGYISEGDEYKIVIDEDDYPKLKTIRLICEYIEEKQATRH